MIIVIAALLQPVPDSAVPILRLDPPTVEEQTYPQYTFNCRLKLLGGKDAKLRFRQTGARAYIDENEVDSDLRIKQTPRVVSVVDDSANLLKDYKIESYFGPGFGKIYGRTGVSRVELEFERTDVAGLQALIVRVGGVYPTVSAIGFCEVVETPQAPLTTAETSKVTAP